MTNYSKVIKEFDKLYGNSNNTCFSEDYDIKSSDFYEEIIIFIKEALKEQKKEWVEKCLKIVDESKAMFFRKKRDEIAEYIAGEACFEMKETISNNICRLLKDLELR